MAFVVRRRVPSLRKELLDRRFAGHERGRVAPFASSMSAPCQQTRPAHRGELLIQEKKATAWVVPARRPRRSIARRTPRRAVDDGRGSCPAVVARCREAPPPLPHQPGEQEGERLLVDGDLMEENLRTDAEAHVARALLARHLRIYPSAPAKLDRLGGDHRPVFLRELPYGVDADRGNATSVSAELTIPPAPLLKQKHPSPH